MCVRIVCLVASFIFSLFLPVNVEKMKRNIKGKKKKQKDSKEKFSSGASDPKHEITLYTTRRAIYFNSTLFTFLSIFNSQMS